MPVAVPFKTRVTVFTEMRRPVLLDARWTVRTELEGSRRNKNANHLLRRNAMSMIIESLQWGYDGGGFCGGPVEGAYIAELKFRDAEGVERYACLSVYQDSRQLRFARQSLFDFQVDDLPAAENFDAALDKLDSMTDDMMDYLDGDDVDGALKDSPYRNVVRLLRLAMHVYFDDDDHRTAEEFLAPYSGVDVDTLDIPVVTESWRDWNGEEEEAEEKDAGEGFCLG